MRILHALSQTELTGSEVYAFELATHQSSQGHQVLTISDNFHKSFPGIKLSLPLATKSFWQRMQNILALRRILRQESIDVIHCHSRGACRNLYWASRGLGIPMVTTIHGLQHRSFSKKSFDIFGDYLFAVCEAMYDQQITEFKRPKESLEVLRNPISVKPMLPKESSQPRLLLMGRNSGPKGENLKYLALRFSKTWLEKIPGLQVSLILSGIDSSELKALKQKLPGVSIQGSILTALDEIRNADLIVGAGRIAVEALMLGKSVIGLGESEAFGIVTQENWQQGLRNNFGDVGPNQVTPESLQLVSDQVLVFFTENLRPVVPKELIEKQYGAARINERVLEVYRTERIRKKIGWLPILMYHKVITDKRDGQHRIFIKQENFRKHMQSLSRWGFQFLSFQELSDFWNEKRPLSELSRKCVVITFDDGYINNLDYALPILKEFNAKATIYLLADHSILTNSWDQGSGENPDPLMSLEQKRSLDPKVIEVGSHGLRHDRLPPKTDEEILSEMRVSKSILEHDLGRPIVSFAYAFGDIDPRLPCLAEKAGYHFAVNTDRGPVEWTRNPWSLFRVSMFPEDNAWSLWKKTSKWYRKYYFNKRGH